MGRREIGVFVGSAALWTLSACGTVTMKAPPGVAQQNQLPIAGYSGNVQTFREKDITIGSYAITNIDRDWDKGSGQSAGPWSRSAQKKAYRFDLKSQGRTVHGECNESAVANSVAGFGKSKVTFKCTCADGGTTLTTLDMTDGSGSAELGSGQKFEVATVHESEQGASSSRALGYHFRSDAGEGALDVTGSGRAWVPKDLGEEPLLNLVCGYAGLVLYRPTES